MKKYKTTGNWSATIEVVECEKETAASVWVKWNPTSIARRNNKRSSYENYFDSFQEAKDFLIKQGKTKVESARRGLEEANSYLGNANGLRNAQRTHAATGWV